MAATIVSVINNKGGVSKTTSSVFFGEILSFFGKRVLLVDTDESGNLSLYFKHFQEDSESILQGLETPAQNNISEIFKHRYRTEEEVSKSIYSVHANLDILPSSKRFALIPDFLLLQSRTSNLNNNIILKKALQTIADNYDYIFIDTAPRNDILTINCLMASDYFVVPVRSEAFSFKGFREVLVGVERLKDEYNIPVEFLGVFQSSAETNTNVYKDLNAEFQTLLGDKNLPCVRKDVKANDLITYGYDLIKYTSSSNILYDYCQLLISMNILDAATVSLIKRAYEK